MREVLLVGDVRWVWVLCGFGRRRERGRWLRPRLLRSDFGVVGVMVNVMCGWVVVGTVVGGV